MYPLVESLKYQNGKLFHIEYHNARLNNTRKVLYDAADQWNLAKLISLPEFEKDVVYKCRFLYGKEPGHAEFAKYTMKQITSLKLVEDNEIDYSIKYTEKKRFDLLKQQCEVDCDILIVKNGYITDTSYSNIVFSDGKSWFTPAKPLLNGTKRQYYLDQKLITPAEIPVEKLNQFKCARVINALIDLDESPEIQIQNITW